MLADRLFSISIVFALFAIVSYPASSASNVTGETGRPQVGLVLSGGGALGLAHIGVIRVLEELRIPIDCVVGTSI